MAKRVGHVGVGSGQLGLQVNQVAVKLTRIFQTIFLFLFLFFEIDAIYQLFMSSLTVIIFSLVILLLITTKHLIPKFGATFVPVF